MATIWNIIPTGATIISSSDTECTVNFPENTTQSPITYTLTCNIDNKCTATKDI